MVKNCSKHGLTKFNRQKNGNKGYRDRCSKCAVESVTKKRRKNKREYVEYMGGECWLCTEDEPICLEFHHINSNNKSFGVSASGLTRARKTVLEELDKCAMLCANCHRKVERRIATNNPG